MPPPFKSVTLEELDVLLRDFPFRRRIDAVHMHHTWRPNHAQYKGQSTIAGMWRTHTVDNGWSDIAQHLTIGPDGSLWPCRNWNTPPASASGHNGTSASGPFMFEMIGDFDRGKDPFEGAQKNAALRVVALVQDRFGLPGKSLRFHNQMSGKTCPGSVVDYEDTLAAVKALRKPLPRPEAADMPDANESTAGIERAATASGTAETILSMLRDEDRVVSSTTGADDELPEREGWPPSKDASVATSHQEAQQGDTLSIDVIEALAPHVVNLSRGRFSSSGNYQTTAQDVDAIFGEGLERAVARRDANNPLRIVIWAHGGLISEKAGLAIAHKHLLWWQGNDVYPLYMIWETGLLAALGRLLTGRSSGPELGLGDRLTEFTDARVEDAARAMHAHAIWADMKQNAQLAVDDDGAAAYVARKLASFCQRHGDAVEIHAVGHSAGSIFHASFLPTAIACGVPTVRSIALLAPAIRIDRFTEQLAPLVGQDRPIAELAMFTMNDLRERDDSCLGIYRKSLLHLIHQALEEEPEAPILGLEVDVRADPAMRRLFNLGEETGGPGAVLWSKSPAGAAPQERTQSVTHGGFDDDPATMDSVLRRILRRDAIALSYAGVAPDANTGGPGDTPSGNIVLGNEGSGVVGSADEERFGVAFDVLDAFERAAAATSDELEYVQTEASASAITFGPNARSTDVTAHSRAVLEEIMRKAGVTMVQISSTSRGPTDQARVMYNNIVQFGIVHQKRLYGPVGDQIIDVYARERAAGRDPVAIKAAMTEEIIRVGPTRVSRHASDPKVLNVFDIAPSSIGRKVQFEQAVLADRRVSKFLKPPADPGFHLEIPQP